MATTTEEVVRKAYHYAEGDVLDVQAFVGLFTEDGVFRDMVNGNKYRGDVVAIELSDDPVRPRHPSATAGHLHPARSRPPQDPVQPTGAKLGINPDFATAVAA